MKIVGVAAAAIAALLMITQGASAQYGQSPQWRQQAPRQQVPQRQNSGGGGGGGGGACVPSGFARLSRNCSVNTGGCQRMPDSCNRGWCCP